MSKRGIFKGAWDAFYEFFFPKSVRWYRYPNKSVKYFRYPSPGSEPINQEMNYFDYKTAYRDSIHNIRYITDLHPQDQSFMTVGHSFSSTIEERLISTGCLDPKNAKDAKAVETAKENYQKEFGVSVDQRFVVDEIKVNDVPLDTREGIAQSLRVFLSKRRDVNAQESYSNNLDDIYIAPSFYHFKTFDYQADDPVLRQARLDLEYYLEEITEKRKNLGEIRVFQGDANFWKILDNSFSTENIRLVQSKVGDTVTELDPNVIERGRHQQEFHRHGTVVFPVKSETIN